MNLVSNIPKAYFDRFIPRPRDGFSSTNMRNNFMALASGDFLPCRAITSIVIETHDVGTDSASAALYSGTGVTVSKEGTNQYQGLACIKATVDVNGNRQIRVDFSRIVQYYCGYSMLQSPRLVIICFPLCPPSHPI